MPCRAKDADYAWDRMDRFKMDGRSWKVDYATRSDFKFFGWKWFEDSPIKERSRSRSRYNQPTVATHHAYPVCTCPFSNICELGPEPFT